MQGTCGCRRATRDEAAELTDYHFELFGSHCHAYLRLPNADTKHPSFGVIFSPFKCCKITARLITSECRIQRAHHEATLLNLARALCFEYNGGCMVLLTRHLATHDEAGRKRHAELKALLILTFLA